jgi:hypothetical protein
MMMRFESTSFGVGSLVRFKSRESWPWQHGIYRGVEEREGCSVAYLFSDTPLGPVTRRLTYWPEFIETAVTEVWRRK